MAATGWIRRDGKTTTRRHDHLSSRANGLHWVLDMTSDEDRARSRKDHAPENLATVRKLALDLRRTARQNISAWRQRKRSGWSDPVARSILGQMR